MSEIEAFLNVKIKNLNKKGLFKEEKIILSKQSNIIRTTHNSKIVNLCSNNYLGLANNKEINEEAIISIKKYGFGMASVRFICGTHAIHKKLEATISKVSIRIRHKVSKKKIT